MKRELSKFSQRHPTHTESVSLSDARGIAYLTFYCDDLDATLAKAEEGGSERRSDPALLAQELDTRIAFLTDPEGNAIELVERKDLSNYRSDLAGWPRKR